MKFNRSSNKILIIIIKLFKAENFIFNLYIKDLRVI